MNAPHAGGWGGRRRLVAARALVGALTVTGAVVGGWADAAPAAFYRTFPGFGRHWLPPLGPYNEHLVRDFGALNLALAAAALVAAITLSRSATTTATVAWLVYSVPHLIFHATHGEGFVAGDDIAVLVTLAAATVVAAVALWLVLTAPVPAREPGREPSPQPSMRSEVRT